MNLILQWHFKNKVKNLTFIVGGFPLLNTVIDMSLYNWEIEITISLSGSFFYNIRSDLQTHHKKSCWEVLLGSAIMFHI